MSLFLPDVNVLVALTLRNHTHTAAAHRWYEKEQRPSLHVCRATQLSLLRFLSNGAGASLEVLSNDAAWSLYRSLIARRNIMFSQEPDGLDEVLGKYGHFGKSAPKLWADAYLAAFATAAGLRLVTFDRALAKMVPKSIELRA